MILLFLILKKIFCQMVFMSFKINKMFYFFEQRAIKPEGRGVARGAPPLTDSGGALPPPPQDFEDKLRGHETEGG